MGEQWILMDLLGTQPEKEFPLLKGELVFWRVGRKTPGHLRRWSFSKPSAAPHTASGGPGDVTTTLFVCLNRKDPPGKWGVLHRGDANSSGEAANQPRDATDTIHVHNRSKEESNHRPYFEKRPQQWLLLSYWFSAPAGLFTLQIVLNLLSVEMGEGDGQNEPTIEDAKISLHPPPNFSFQWLLLASRQASLFLPSFISDGALTLVYVNTLTSAAEMSGISS